MYYYTYHHYTISFYIFYGYSTKKRLKWEVKVGMVIASSASGARGRGFESSKQDVWNAALYMDVHERSPHCPKVVLFQFFFIQRNIL
jgi:hypothetical protein